MGQSKQWAEFLYETCAPNLIKLLAREKSDDDQYLDAVVGVLKAFLSIYLVELKNKRYNFEFTMAMSWVFNPACSLHQRHFQISENELQKIKTMHQAWRKEIKAGDKLDICIKYDEVTSLLGWA